MHASRLLGLCLIIKSEVRCFKVPQPRSQGIKYTEILNLFCKQYNIDRTFHRFVDAINPFHLRAWRAAPKAEPFASNSQAFFAQAADLKASAMFFPHPVCGFICC